MKKKIRSTIADLSGLLTSAKARASYQGLDRLSVLIASLGTLRIIFITQPV